MIEYIKRKLTEMRLARELNIALDNLTDKTLLERMGY